MVKIICSCDRMYVVHFNVLASTCVCAMKLLYHPILYASTNVDHEKQCLPMALGNSFDVLWDHTSSSST